MVNSSSGEITRLLAELEDRKEEAAPRLYELLYHELRRIAQHHFANDRADHSLSKPLLWFMKRICGSWLEVSLSRRLPK